MTALVEQEATVELQARNRLRQLRVLFTFTSAGVAAIAAAILLAGHLLIERFQQIERDDTLQKAAQLYHAADADFRQLSLANRNNAEWDDAADFIATGSPAFIRSNFTAVSMDELHADVVWILDRNGRSVYSAHYDRVSRSLSAPAPGALLDSLQPFLRASKAASEASPAAAVVRTSFGPMAVSACEITRTDRTHPTGATMLLGRLLGPAEIARISATSQLPLTVTWLPDSQQRPAGIPEAVFKWANEPRATTTMAMASGGNSISGYSLIRDFAGAPIAVLSTSLPRSIYMLGLRSTWGLLGSVAAIVIAFTFTILLLLRRLRRTFAKYEAAQHRLRRLTRQLQDLVILADPSDLRILDANDATLRKLNCRLDELHARRVSDLYPALSIDVLESTSVGTEGTFYQATPLLSDRSSPSVADVTVTRLQEPDREYLCFIGTDVTNRQQVVDLKQEHERNVSYMAQHDALTGLPNRLYLQTHLQSLLHQTVGGLELNAVYYLNLDEFKLVNHSHGRGVGDQILQTVARRLQALVQGRDVVARIGGDEFVVVVSALPDMAAVLRLAARLQAAMRGPFALDQDAVSVSASIGIALFPDHGTVMQTVLKHAEIAMYCAKQTERDSYQLFSVEMALHIKGRADLLHSLRHAIGTSQFYMEYQPICDLQSGQIVLVEALARWEHPELGLIAPSTFIATAEQNDEMVALGAQLLELVLKDVRQWHQGKVPLVPVLLNVSAQQIERTDFAALVAQLCETAGIEQRYIGFELAESLLLHESARMHQTIRQLRSAGSRVLIDRFGTGYSSLTNLDELSVDGLKIDRSYVQEAAGSATKLPIVRAVIEMAHGLAMTTVAEGVETSEQLELLAGLGCDFGQGFFLSQALTADECRALLEQRPGMDVLPEPVRAA